MEESSFLKEWARILVEQVSYETPKKVSEDVLVAKEKHLQKPILESLNKQNVHTKHKFNRQRSKEVFVEKQ